MVPLIAAGVNFVVYTPDTGEIVSFEPRMEKFFTVALSTINEYVREDPATDELPGLTMRRYSPLINEFSNLPSRKVSSGYEQHVEFQLFPDFISSDE